jgi:hypothetical protein
LSIISQWIEGIDVKKERKRPAVEAFKSPAINLANQGRMGCSRQ